MELVISGLRIPVENDGADEYLKAASRKLETGSQGISLIKILAKSLDTRDREQFYYVVSIAVKTPDNFENGRNFPVYADNIRAAARPAGCKERPVIIGFGPAGMFAALELIERGIKPVIFERGKKIEDRHVDVQLFIEEGKLDEESNIQFGEGGAGSYSDGKLFSRANNSLYSDKVLRTFIKFGAPEEIGYCAKPHLGTDVLREIVVNIRNHVLLNGGEIHYGSKMTGIIISKGKALGVVINGEREYRSSIIYLAVGHSARDTFEMLNGAGIALEQKAISVGLRIEHPAGTVNLMRYGAKYKDFSVLGAATYSFNHMNRITKRSVNTFCMCPGGEIINASSSAGLLAVNGMSYSGRQSAFSNSAIVVTCRAGDYGAAHPLAGIEFQKNMERKAFAAGGSGWKAPAQNLMDFLEGRVSGRLNRNSYKMGAVAADMSVIFPEFITGELKGAFNEWKKDYPLFVSEQAILLGAETRTSCPVRMIRDDNYVSVNVKNLCPLGEGAGYAGGITSSAADAIKSVERSLPLIAV